MLLLTANEFVKEGEGFVDALVAGGYRGHPPLAMTESIITAVVRLHTQAGNFGEALQVGSDCIAIPLPFANASTCSNPPP